MPCTYLQCERAGGNRKVGWVEINALCIADQNHQWWGIIIDHISKFKPI